MSVSPRRVIGLLLATGVLLGTGCARECEPIVLGSPALLFAKTPSPIPATAIGRRPWPATLGAVESVEETVFVEYYRNFTGNAFMERNNPHQYFRSYRTGKRLR
jgi:hypothetical protein